MKNIILQLYDIQGLNVSYYEMPGSTNSGCYGLGEVRILCGVPGSSDAPVVVGRLSRKSRIYESTQKKSYQIAHHNFNVLIPHLSLCGKEGQDKGCLRSVNY